MTTPVLVVTGYLGAGKTTLINSILAEANGLRIAAIVNDFGAINVDEELIAARSAGVVGLANGCICCTLQGDLLRTLKLLLAVQPAPDYIVVEASGIADPAGIIQCLLDPVLWRSVRLDSVTCVIDTQDVAGVPARRQDDLWRAQLRTANIILLTKSSLVDDHVLKVVERELARQTNALIFDIDRARLPQEILLGGNLPALSAFAATSAVSPHHTDRFAKIEWQTKTPISLEKLQRVISEHESELERAKGIFRFLEKPGIVYLLQTVGRRSTLEPIADDRAPGCRLVIIGEKSYLRAELLLERLDALKELSTNA